MLGLQRWMRHRAWPYTRYSLVYRIRFKNNLIHLSCQRREKKKSWLAQKSCKMLSRRWFWKDLKDDFSNESTFRMRWPKYWMAGWHHRLDAHEFGWTLGAGDGQGGLVCWDSWGCKKLATSERLNWTELSSLRRLFLPQECKDILLCFLLDVWNCSILKILAFMFPFRSCLKLPFSFLTSPNSPSRPTFPSSP